MTRLRFDIEADNLLDDVTKIHCIVTQDKDTGEISSYYDDETIFHDTMAGDIREGIKALLAADELVGQNILGYDIPVIEKLYKVEFHPFANKAQVLKDLLVCSRIIWLDLKDRDFIFRKKNPDFPGNLIGSHSLKAWGWRLGERKGDFGEMNDWSTFSLKMLEYCIQDIKVTEAHEKHIDSKGYSEEALLNEHRFAYLIHLQQQHGFRFNRQAAVELYGKLSQRRHELELVLKEACVGWHEEMKVPAHYRMTWTDSSGINHEFQGSTKTECETERKARGIKPKACVIEAGSNKQRHTPFNSGSHDHIAKFLVERYSWKPLVFTDDGKAQTSEEVLSSLPYPEIKPIVEYLMVEKRIGQLAEGNQAWLKLEKNGRMHGEVNTNGAVSSRVTHSKPNMSQVPAIDKPYGKECRALFCADEGQVLVGADASGIQLRSLAHYMYPWDGGEYAKIVLGGDIHSANQKAAGFATRDMAKTFIYAFLLGAGPGKVGSIAGTNASHGRQLMESFLEKFPALAALKSAVSERVKTKGYLVGLDGRKLPCRSEHAALSSLLQGFEACVMKKANWIMFSSLTKQGLVHGKDFAQVGYFHDEVQVSCRSDLGDLIGKTCVSAIEQAGIELKSTCPLTGAYRVGGNWCETH
jgi:DNA polymerase I-like protein with 3'-5' exonuclease and polymerase domains